jgi:hypothetical protein
MQHAGWAWGAMASQSFNAPHSSDSKWLHEIQRSFAGSIDEFGHAFTDLREHSAQASVKEQGLVVSYNEVVEIADQSRAKKR